MTVITQDFSSHNDFEFLSLELIEKMHTINNKLSADYTATHPQSLISIKRDDKTYMLNVDEDIADLISCLWDKGFTTYNSCCGDGDDYPYVHMAMPSTYEKYVEVCSIVRKYWSNKYIEVSMDPLNFAIAFYAKDSIDDCDDVCYTFEPLNNTEVGGSNYDEV